MAVIVDDRSHASPDAAMAGDDVVVVADEQEVTGEGGRAPALCPLVSPDRSSIVNPTLPTLAEREQVNQLDRLRRHDPVLEARAPLAFAAPTRRELHRLSPPAWWHLRDRPGAGFWSPAARGSHTLRGIGRERQEPGCVERADLALRGGATGPAVIPQGRVSRAVRPAHAALVSPQVLRQRRRTNRRGALLVHQSSGLDERNQPLPSASAL